MIAIVKKRVRREILKRKILRKSYAFFSTHPNFTFYSNNSTILFGRTCRYVFIRLHKVGGTSVAEALGIEKRHYTCKEAIQLVGRKNWDRCYTFAFVRNPFSKIVSSYNYFTQKNYHSMKEIPISFDSWVEKTYGNKKDPFYYSSVKWFQPQVDWLKDDLDEISIDKIGKLENIEEDFVEIMNNIGIDAPIPHVNKSRKVDYRKYYNDITYDIVKSWHQEDLDTFGYTFDNG